MPIYLIRHGQSEFNAVARDGIDALIYDAPLTELGRAQADRAKEIVRDFGIRQVITSPLTRAIQTALRIFEGQAPIGVQAGHHEMLCNSCDVGRHRDALAQDFPQLDFAHLPDRWWHDGPENRHGVAHEPLEVFQQRVRRFDQVLRESKTRPLAIVGHGLFFQEMIGRMPDNAEVIRYELP
ncbi:histidine phosphatase family protein [Kiloniella laminariae]|uniref:Histidine phosphatase family protein n=1 Tax=Kiloniella laminariae TaxID=454162 RepID=A0ABT4LHD6_9PROT|nr:histidine phosphatase family protein [Kiloniella laminariae]MCZ4279766.1 histidine phosphatase family protein [Kiloniella laminariae]